MPVWQQKAARVKEKETSHLKQSRPVSGFVCVKSSTIIYYFMSHMDHERVMKRQTI